LTGSLDGLPRFAVVCGREFLAAGGKRGRRGVLGRNGGEIRLGRSMDLFPGDAIGRAVDGAFCTDNPAHVRCRSAAGCKFRVGADELTIPGCAAVRRAGNEPSAGQSITNLWVGRPDWDVRGAFLDDEGSLTGWLIWLLGSSEPETGEKKTDMSNHGITSRCEIVRRTTKKKIKNDVCSASNPTSICAEANTCGSASSSCVIDIRRNGSNYATAKPSLPDAEPNKELAARIAPSPSPPNIQVATPIPSALAPPPARSMPCAATPTPNSSFPPTNSRIVLLLGRHSANVRAQFAAKFEWQSHSAINSREGGYEEATRSSVCTGIAVMPVRTRTIRECELEFQSAVRCLRPPRALIAIPWQARWRMGGSGRT